MHQNKLIQILCSLNKEEWRSCSRYIYGALNKHSKELILFDYIRKNCNSENHLKLTVDTIHVKLDSNLKRKAFLSLMSRLTIHVEEFLALSEFKSLNYEFDRLMVLAKVYRSKGLYTLFEKTIKRAQMQLKGNSSLDLNYERKIFESNHLLYFSKIPKSKERSTNLYLAAQYKQKYWANINEFYTLEFENRKKLFNDSIVGYTLEEENELYELLKALKILISGQNESIFQKLKNEMFQKHDRMSHDIKEIVLIHLINFSLTQIKKGILYDFIEELAELYSFGLNTGILLNQGKISDIQFLNILDAVSKSQSKAFRDGEAFIEKWISLVGTRDVQTIKNISLALWHFSKQHYNETLDFLNASDISYDSLNVNLRWRWMRICCLCTLYPDYEEKRELLNTYRKYFTRNRAKLNEETYLGSMNLLRVIEMIWFGEKQKDINKIIAGNKYIINGYWIEQQIKMSGSLLREPNNVDD